MARKKIAPVAEKSSAAAQPGRTPKWTVMVFMGADTIEGNEPLDKAADSDLAEIEDAAGSPNLEIFVQIHRSTGPTKRFHFDSARRPKVSPILNVAREQALIGFIADSLEEADHRRDDHSMLVLWGHAYDFAFSRSRTRNGDIDAIDFVELSGMLSRLQAVTNERFADQYADSQQQSPTLDIIAFDACDVATVEMACELQPFAKYLLGSEIAVPIPGFPYDRILGRLKQPKGDLMTPAEFGSYAVRRYCESYPSSSPASLTFLDLAQAPELRARAELLALALTARIGDADDRQLIEDLFKSSQTGEGRPYVDVADLCLGLVRQSSDPFVVQAARALGDLLIGPRPPLVGESDAGKGRPLIIDHGRNAGELARLNGISLYAPHVGSDDNFAAVRSVYDEFVFARNTFWSRLVHALAD